MNLTPLTAVSPVDGRYRGKTESLARYFSEYAFIRYRLKVEIRYFLFLHKKGFFKLRKTDVKNLEEMIGKFSTSDAIAIKEIEKVTNHDLKAVEYFLKDKMRESGLEGVSEWVHFALTSQDINNTAIPLMWKDAVTNEYLPELSRLLTDIEALAGDWKSIPMLARTHGQPASPTTVGKEFRVFAERLKVQIKLMTNLPHTGKFGGATGNLNAHYAAFPKENWHRLADEFLKEDLGLTRQKFTTQIEHYDTLSAFFDALSRINTILIDFTRDVWTYISMDYFGQKLKKNEVGSSAMPHKVNPIDFENAEGNLGIANALFRHFSEKLPISRLQRDLSDSTVLRNLGVPMAHSLLSFQSIKKGLSKLTLNSSKIEADLENNWAVVAEAIQTILRRENYPQPYEALKELTRGNQKIDKDAIINFISGLDISDNLKQELKKITPHNFIGNTGF